MLKDIWWKSSFYERNEYYIVNRKCVCVRIIKTTANTL